MRNFGIGMLPARASEETKGLLKEGASGRRAAVDHVVAELGGTVEAMYFAFGEDDLVCIVDLPDPAPWPPSVSRSRPASRSAHGRLPFSPLTR